MWVVSIRFYVSLRQFVIANKRACRETNTNHTPTQKSRENGFFSLGFPYFRGFDTYLRANYNKWAIVRAR